MDCVWHLLHELYIYRNDYKLHVGGVRYLSSTFSLLIFFKQYITIYYSVFNILGVVVIIRRYQYRSSAMQLSS
jgi:hypothetical protein